jgi:hypothetical protein
MMGRQNRDQANLFYEFRLEDRIPKDHLFRRINVFVTPVLSGVREQLKAYYSEIGRPSVDPELMIRMLIVGYCYGIRHERRLCEEIYPITQKSSGRSSHFARRPILQLAGDGYSPPPPCCGVRAATGATIRSNSACGPGAPWIGTCVWMSSFIRLRLL